MITRVLLAAVIAGMIAGAVATAVQVWRVVPLILEAETYENAGVASDHAHDSAKAAQAPHSHGEAEAWAPEDGLERTLYTLMSNVVMGVAFALLLAAAVMFTGRGITPQNGIVWGLIGFLVFTLAPTAGLSPELPGMPAADLAMRQLWWWGTVAATGGGIALIALSGTVWAKATGAALIAVPHLLGAPQPESHASAVPPALAADFAAATIASMALFWAVLGISLGWFLSRARQQTQV